jgi:hypothetical protein
MGVTCAQILSRMLIYYVILILLVPAIAAKVVDYFILEQDSYEEMAAEQVISMSLFYIAIPYLWDSIDEYSKRVVVGIDEAPTAPTITGDDKKEE